MKPVILRVPRLFSLSAVFLFTGLISCSKTDKQEKVDVSPLTEAQRAELLEKGKNIAAQSFAALSGQLTSAMASGGVAEAISYCHEKAIPLTDSLSRAHHALIRRTSLKTRNPLNQPDETERQLLEAYAESARRGEALQPQLQWLEDGSTLFTAPILTKGLCTNCHGEPGKTIQTDDYALIRSLYPEDQAIGFEEGSLRGMWAIRLYPEAK